eukprot:TRINITY_DN1029_c0_g2_i13.p1 TRINITY_DN1029_c0_g2~~TRINITY_DN1029_c0_g2_i13.p1  ORF type:complete len:870 (-),score=304.56 TRINITY_DN1029_c0_g2_i13:23-2632(-)
MVKNFLVADEIGNTIYFDKQHGRMLATPIVVTDSLISENFHQQVRCMRAGNLLIVFQRFDSLLLFVASDQGEPECFLRRELYSLHQLLELKFGDKLMKWVKEMRHTHFTKAARQLRVTVATMSHLADTHQSFLVQAIEHLEVNNDLRERTQEVMKQSIEKNSEDFVEESMQGLLFVGTKLVANFSSPKSFDFNVGDHLMTVISVLTFFRPCIPEGIDDMDPEEDFDVVDYVNDVEYPGEAMQGDKEGEMQVNMTTDDVSVITEEGYVSADEFDEEDFIDLSVAYGVNELMVSKEYLEWMVSIVCQKFSNGVKGGQKDKKEGEGNEEEKEKGKEEVESKEDQEKEEVESKEGQEKEEVESKEDQEKEEGEKVADGEVEEVTVIETSKSDENENDDEVEQEGVSPLEETDEEVTQQILSELESMRSGSRGISVAVIQLCLNLLNQTDKEDEKPVLSINGIFDEETENVCRQVKKQMDESSSQTATDEKKVEINDVMLQHIITGTMDRLIKSYGEGLDGMPTPRNNYNGLFTSKVGIPRNESEDDAQPSYGKHTSSSSIVSADSFSEGRRSLELSSSPNGTRFYPTMATLAEEDEETQNVASSEEELVEEEAAPEPLADIDTEDDGDTMFEKLYLPLSKKVPCLVYAAEVADNVILMLLDRKPEAKTEDKDDEKRQELYKRRMMNRVRNDVRESISNFVEFLITKERTHVTMLSYLHYYPGLCHFIFVDRRSNQVVAPTIVPLHGDEENSGKTSEESTTVLKERVWDMVYEAQKHLAQGYTSMLMKCGEFQYSYRLWMEDSEGNPLPLDQNQRLEFLVSNSESYKDLGKGLFPSMRGVRCFELYTLYLGILSCENVEAHNDRLINELFSRSS